MREEKATVLIFMLNYCKWWCHQAISDVKSDENYFQSVSESYFVTTICWWFKNLPISLRFLIDVEITFICTGRICHGVNSISSFRSLLLRIYCHASNYSLYPSRKSNFRLNVAFESQRDWFIPCIEETQLSHAPRCRQPRNTVDDESCLFNGLTKQCYRCENDWKHANSARYKLSENVHRNKMLVYSFWIPIF